MANYQLLIHRPNGVVYEPIVKDNITWSTERSGTAGKLNFTVVKDDVISFDEGDYVTFRIDGKGVFQGRILTKTRDKEHHIECTAYDQTYYLKNNDTYVYENRTLDDVIRTIANDFNLSVGTLVETGYKMSRIEDNVSLWDIIGNAMDETTLGTGNIYVLYDDFGKLQLRNIKSMRTPYLLDYDTALNFDYTTSLADDTYNRIKLVYENDEAGTRDVYIAEDSDNIDRWGLLQFYETINDPDIGKDKVNAMLELKNRKTRKLTAEALGDVSVRAGCWFPIHLNIGDIVVNQYLIAEKVNHKFSESNHTMEITVSGSGGFVA